MTSDRLAPRALVAASLASLVAACPGPPATTARTATSVPASPPQPPGAPAAVAVLLPRLASLRLVADGEAGVRRFTAGSLRVEIRDGRAHLAGGLATPIRAATAIPGGWVFVGEDGTIAAASTYLGALRRLGELPGGAGILPSPGRLVLRDRDGALWTTGGEPAGLAPLRRGPGDGPRLLDAAFVDERRGAAIEEPGRLLATADGGRTWSPIDGATVGPFGVTVEAGRLLVDAAAGPHVLEPEGRLSPRPPAPEPEAGADGEVEAPVASDEEVRLTVLALGQVHPAYWAGQATLPDGRLVLDWSGPPAIDLLDPGTGAAAGHLGAEALPDGFAHGLLFQWGEAFGIACRGASPGGPAYEVFRLADGVRVERIAALGTVPERLVPSSRSELLAVVARGCGAEAPAVTAPRALCVVAPGERAFREAPVRLAAREEPIAVHGTRVLLQRGWDPGTHRVVDLASGREVALAEPEPLGARSYDFGEDGTVVGVGAARAGSSPIGVIVVSPAGTPELRRVPRGARSAALLDAAHGVAVGRRLDEMWTTADGGRSWQPLAVPLDGDPTRLALEREDARAPAIRCERGRCVVRGEDFDVYVDPAGAARAHRDPPLAARRPAPPARDGAGRDDDAPAPILGGGLRCGPAAGQGAGLDVGAARASSRRRLLVTPDARVTLEARPRPGAPRRAGRAAAGPAPIEVRVEWRGRDGAGPFTARTPWASVPWYDLDAAWLDSFEREEEEAPLPTPESVLDERLTVKAATRGALTLVRCTDRCRAYGATPGDALGDLQPFAGQPDVDDLVDDAQVAGDAGGQTTVVSDLEHPPGDRRGPRNRVDLVALLEPGGRRAALRAIVRPGSASSPTLARRDGAAGVVIDPPSRETRTFRFLPVTGDEVVTVEVSPFALAPTACADGAPAGLELLLPIRAIGGLLLDDAEAQALALEVRGTATIGVTARGLCLRAVAGEVVDGARPTGRAVLVTPRGGRLEGLLLGGRRDVPLTCRWDE